MLRGVQKTLKELSQPQLWACNQGKRVIRLRAKRKLGSQGKEVARVQAKRKPGSQGKEAARVQAKRKPGSHITYSRENVRECEGVNTHTPKATPTLGDGVPVDSQNFRERFQGSKLNVLSRSFYHWKALITQMSKMGSHCSFKHRKHKLQPKEGLAV